MYSLHLTLPLLSMFSVYSFITNEMCLGGNFLTRLLLDRQIKGNIFFVPVSKTLNLMVIVWRLFHHIWDREPEFQSDEDAISRLEYCWHILDPVLYYWSWMTFGLDQNSVLRSLSLTSQSSIFWWPQELHCQNIALHMT